MSSNGNNVQLKAEVRNEFTRASRRDIRMNGGVPGVVYGTGIESIPVSVNLKEAAKLFTSGRSEVFKLDIEGSDTVQVLVKEVQQRAGKVVHVDFLRISMNKPVRVSIPIDYQGTAAGTKTGGILQTQLMELEIEGLPADLPTVIEADITALEIGDKMTVDDLKLPDGVKTWASGEEILASVIVPRAVEAASEAAATEEAGEGAEDTGGTEEE